ncbi:hypothetical protein M0802_014448 [Mischocyttarus mexicanus]|nr:hypothetical protein M0802_014448 [Mischocyttarus mexicanus]
MFRQDGSRW